jgi:hypothetical protein
LPGAHHRGTRDGGPDRCRPQACSWSIPGQIPSLLCWKLSSLRRIGRAHVAVDSLLMIAQRMEREQGGRLTEFQVRTSAAFLL